MERALQGPGWPAGGTSLWAGRVWSQLLHKPARLLPAGSCGGEAAGAECAPGPGHAPKSTVSHKEPEDETLRQCTQGGLPDVPKADMGVVGLMPLSHLVAPATGRGSLEEQSLWVTCPLLFHPGATPHRSRDCSRPHAFSLNNSLGWPTGPLPPASRHSFIPSHR